MKKLGDFRVNGFRVLWGINGEKGKIWVVGGGFGWRRTAGGGVSVVGKVDAGGGCGWFWIFGRREPEMGFGGCTAAGKNWGKGEKM
jgi:hypothetical protein